MYIDHAVVCTNTRINVLENVMVSEGLKKIFFGRRIF